MRKGSIIIFVGLAVIGLMGSLLIPQAATRAKVDEYWTGEYFENQNLQGTPDFTREDIVLTFIWGDGPPAEVTELVEGWSGDHFSVRWTKVDYFYDDTYIFAARADDGVRMYVDGKIVLDEWHDSQFQWYATEVEMTAGEHTIKVEYYEEDGAAAIQAGYYPKHPLPTPTVSPTATKKSTSTGGSGGSGGGSGGGGSGSGSSSTSTPRPTRTPAPTRTPGLQGTTQPEGGVGAPTGGGIGPVVEELDSKFFLQTGFPGAVVREGGSGGSYAYVKNRNSRSTYEARWVFWPTQSGYYDVYAYMPAPNSRSTRSAVYGVYHNNQNSGQIVVDQFSFDQEWVLMGTFFFAAGTPQYVFMTNATGETDSTREIAMDAMMIVYKP